MAQQLTSLLLSLANAARNQRNRQPEATANPQAAGFSLPVQAQINNQTNETNQPARATPNMPIQSLVEFSDEDKQKLENNLKDSPIKMQQFRRAGEFFTRLGGGPPLLDSRVFATGTPEDQKLYNEQRLLARNRGIGEMLLLLSDALGGKDVAARALERAEARRPEPEELPSPNERLRLRELEVLQKIQQIADENPEIALPDIIKKLDAPDRLFYQDYIEKKQPIDPFLPYGINLGPSPVNTSPGANQQPPQPVIQDSEIINLGSIE